MPQENAASALNRPYQPTPQNPDRSAPLSGWAVEQLRRVLRLQEGEGHRAEDRVRGWTRGLVARVQQELSGAAAEPEQVTDHLWSALLQEGQTGAARFFRPYRAHQGRALWIRGSRGGAYPLQRERVEGLLERLCQQPEDSGLEPSRLFRNAQSHLHNGMSEGELVRVLNLTSPAQEVVIQRLCRPNGG
jgi:hypothetical protein